MALNATTLRDSIIAALDAEGVYPNAAAKVESEVLIGILATQVINHFTANAQLNGIAETSGVPVDLEAEVVTDDAALSGGIL